MRFPLRVKVDCGDATHHAELRDWRWYYDDHDCGQLARDAMLVEMGYRDSGCASMLYQEMFSPQWRAPVGASLRLQIAHAIRRYGGPSLWRLMRKLEPRSRAWRETDDVLAAHMAAAAEPTASVQERIEQFLHAVCCDLMLRFPPGIIPPPHERVEATADGAILRVDAELRLTIAQYQQQALDKERAPVEKQYRATLIWGGELPGSVVRGGKQHVPTINWDFDPKALTPRWMSLHVDAVATALQAGLVMYAVQKPTLQRYWWIQDVCSHGYLPTWGTDHNWLDNATDAIHQRAVQLTLDAKIEARLTHKRLRWISERYQLNRP